MSGGSISRKYIYGESTAPPLLVFLIVNVLFTVSELDLKR
jgi:hypothetical protein